MAKNEELFNAIMKGNRNLVVELIQKALDEDADMGDVLDNSMIPAMREMGDRFSRNEVYVPEMLIAARAMQAGLELVEPALAKTGHESLGKVAVGTVKGDLHDIGKNLVAIMLKGAGYEVIDCGVNCDSAKFASAVEEGAQAVLCSALLTTTMPYMKEIVNHFESADVKVVIGGAPVTDDYANSIGADGYGCDANEAVKVVDQLLGKTA
jgi:5-methyltetrahydrofolate--homocysteine methyltransferase